MENQNHNNHNTFAGSTDLLATQQHLMRIEHQLSMMYRGKNPVVVSEYSLVQKIAQSLRVTVYEIGHTIKNMENAEEIHECYCRVLKNINAIIGKEKIIKPHRVADC